MNTKDIKLIHGDCIEEMQKLIDDKYFEIAEKRISTHAAQMRLF